MKDEDVYSGVKKMRQRIPKNRLRRHLETCALAYGCPAGKNFFLGRYEAPLPTATACNARCLGCLSLQTEQGISCSQERIRFTPSPEEIAEIALAHIQRVQKSIVSFGQGCEGDPLLAVNVIEPAIRLIRAQTDQGTIHMNTNGSLPRVIQQLCDAGLDSVRISINSMRPACYNAYFRPQDYAFDDVMESMRIAKGNGKHVALNYLNLPGFTDVPEEIASLDLILSKGMVDMLQWRNLNYDPQKYWRVMNRETPNGKSIGITNLLHMIRERFPRIKYGYFNPAKETF
jgi:pyruvate-formate lyase-activating enzyme